MFRLWSTDELASPRKWRAYLLRIARNADCEDASDREHESHQGYANEQAFAGDRLFFLQRVGTLDGDLLTNANQLPAEDGHGRPERHARKKREVATNPE